MIKSDFSLLIVLSVSLVAYWHGQANAQQSIHADAEACNGCIIEALPHIQLGKDDDPVSISQYMTRVLRNSRGDYLVWPTYTPGEFAVFGANGAFDRTFGKAGEGPGEVGRGSLALWLTNSDSLNIFDFGNGRRAIYSPDWRFIRSVPFRFPSGQAVVLGNGDVVLNSDIGTTESVGFALHRISPDGQLVRSFSPLTEKVFRIGDLTGVRSMSLAPGGAVWAAQNTAYRLELWDTAGSRIEHLHRDVPWFEPYAKPTPGEPFNAPPHPRINAVMADDNGLLWVLLHIPDRDWRPMNMPSEHARATDVPLATIRGFIDSLIEVIDLRTATVVASRRDDDPFIAFITPNEAYKLGETAAGARSLAIWKIQLNRGQGAQR